MHQEVVPSRVRHGGTRMLEAPPTVPMATLLGLLLIAGAWLVSWEGIRPFSRYYFFPIWFGYILAVDGLVLRRRGTSLFKESWRQFAGLFGLSAIYWWLFEALNVPVQNWHYKGVDDWTGLTYVLLASLSFSTVLPAVLETVTLIGSFVPPTRFLTLARPPLPGRRLLVVMGMGLCGVVLPFIWPTQTYPLVWISVLLILEPINWYAGRPSTLRLLASGRVALVLTLFGAGITCGFLWEMWNYYSSPKWFYVLPGVQAPKLFEMPLPGYLGYLPFAIELYAMYNAALLLVGRRSSLERVLQLPRPRRPPLR